MGTLNQDCKEVIMWVAEILVDQEDDPELQEWRTVCCTGYVRPYLFPEEQAAQDFLARWYSMLEPDNRRARNLADEDSAQVEGCTLSTKVVFPAREQYNSFFSNRFPPEIMATIEQYRTRPIRNYIDRTRTLTSIERVLSAVGASATVGHDKSGQIIIYTGLKVSREDPDELVPLTPEDMQDTAEEFVFDTMDLEEGRVDGI
jgi:hypothetical protein